MSGVSDRIGRRRNALRAVSGIDLQTRLYAALIEHVGAETASCASVVRQLDPQRLQAVMASYGEGYEWRWAATPALQTLNDILLELMRRAGVDDVLEAVPVQPMLPMELDPPAPKRGEPL